MGPQARPSGYDTLTNTLYRAISMMYNFAFIPTETFLHPKGQDLFLTEPTSSNICLLKLKKLSAFSGPFE